jgi:hypothetical protein
MNLVSIGEIIYRINEHPLLQSIRRSDIINHVKTVIELVGVPGVKNEKMVSLDVKDYRAELPFDFMERVSVRVYDGTDRIVLTDSTDEFTKFNKEIYGDKKSDHIYTYKIAGQFIYTDFKEGTIEVIYKTYNTDEKGWPMIPRNESLILAIEYYIRWRHFSILADQNANFERSAARAEAQYTWYVGQAMNSLSTPDPVAAQAIGEMLIRMIPIKDNFYTNHKYAGQPERRNTRIW